MFYRSREDWLNILATMPEEGPGIRGDDFLYSADLDWKKYSKYLNLSDGDIILDVGCGHGRMALNFINTNIKYIGIDILSNVIYWARFAFSPWANIYFNLVSIRNGMYTLVGEDPNSFCIKLKDNTVKGIIALSLFTHLETLDVVERYLREFWRVLTHCGTLVATFFLSPVNDCTTDAQRTVFDIVDIYNLFKTTGFKVIEEWGGQTTNWHDQHIFVLKAN